MSRMPIGLKFAVCLDGAGACPPEDCGGTGGCVELLRVLGDPTDEEHEHLSTWVGGPIDPHEFDLALVNARAPDRPLITSRWTSRGTSRVPLSR